MTLHPTTYRGWSVFYDPRPMWHGATFVAIHTDYETSLSGRTRSEVITEIDREEEEWADMERERNNADLRRRAAAEWATLPATLNEQAAYRRDEARIGVERSRGVINHED